ncbi:MAG: phosphatase PAP2 family protein [Rhizobiales bacterium]|nr:phosphatase PAP2 family protein [Hyphomicrobiales bacterium]
MQNYNMKVVWFVGLTLLFLIFPDIDLWFTGLFYTPSQGFFWHDALLPAFSYSAIHKITTFLAIWLLGSLTVQAVLYFQPRLNDAGLSERAIAQREKLKRRASGIWHSGALFMQELAVPARVANGMRRAATGTRSVWRKYNIGAVIAAFIGGIFATLWSGLKNIAMLLPAPKLLYLLLALLLAPGFVVNSVFKDEWGRARPWQTETFGGDKSFTPPWVMVNQCAKNCSFVSGHAAMGFYVFAFGFLAAGAWRRRLFILGCVTGGLVGLGRVVQGDHFLSDVIFSGFIVYFICWLLYRGFEAMGWLGLAEDAPAESPL